MTSTEEFEICPNWSRLYRLLLSTRHTKLCLWSWTTSPRELKLGPRPVGSFNIALRSQTKTGPNRPSWPICDHTSHAGPVLEPCEQWWIRRAPLRLSGIRSCQWLGETHRGPFSNRHRRAIFTTGLIGLSCPASLRKRICQGSPFNRSPYRQKNRSSTELIQLAVPFP